MENFFLQAEAQNGLTDSINEGLFSFLDKINRFQLPHSNFVTDLAIIMILAAIVTLAFFKIRQPLIIGYLFAGMLIGPLSPLWTWFLPEEGPPSAGITGVGILSDITALNLFSEIGVILLLFVIGIEFPYAKIRSIGKISIGIGTLGLFSTLGAVFYAANLMGLNFMDSLFIAAALSISSTAIIIKIVEESKSSEVSKILSSPIKDMFVAIFFVSVGALMDIGHIGNYIFIAIGLIAVAIGMKFGGNLLGSLLFRQPAKKSLRSAFALAAPRGEFSIVIVKAGVDVGAVSPFLFPLVGVISIITSFITPFLFRVGDKVIPKLSKA